jgi:L-threonylcarbamoyladenylate synthase
MASPEALDLAAVRLEAGGVVVIPTDTVYGIAARLDRPAAIERLFELKHRPRSKPVALLVPDLTSARALGEFSPEALDRASSWPGAVTLVLKSRSPLPALGGDGKTVGLRVPDHPWTARLLRRCGPLATTSANPSGARTGVTVGEVLEDLGEGPDLYIDGGPLDAAPSTVISLVGKPEVLR